MDAGVHGLGIADDPPARHLRAVAGIEERLPRPVAPGSSRDPVISQGGERAALPPQALPEQVAPCRHRHQPCVSAANPAMPTPVIPGRNGPEPSGVYDDEQATRPPAPGRPGPRPPPPPPPSHPT